MSNQIPASAQQSYVVDMTIISAKQKDLAFSDSWLLERYRAVLRKINYLRLIHEVIPPKSLLDECDKLYAFVCAFSSEANTLSWAEFEKVNLLTESAWGEAIKKNS